VTLDQFYKNYVLPLMAEKQRSADAYGEQYVGVINAVLAEIWDINNTLQHGFRNYPVGSFEPFAAGDELPYDFRLLVTCAAYGCASRLLVDEAGDESNMIGFLESNYEAGKLKFTKAGYVPVKGAFDDIEENEGE
jgi:hypothetical protein